MARGFVYLAAMVDWFSRKVLAWRLSITLGGGLLRRGAGGGARPARPARDLQHRPGLAVHQPRLHQGAAEGRRSPSAWTARAPGATTSSSSGSGGQSNTRRSTSEPTPASARPAPRSAGIWASTTAGGRIRGLTGKRPTRHTSTGAAIRGSLKRAGATYAAQGVQTNRATSDGREAGLRVQARVVVGMVQLRAAVKRCPDLVGRCPGLDTQAGVVSSRVYFGHHSCPVHKLASS